MSDSDESDEPEMPDQSDKRRSDQQATPRAGIRSALPLLRRFWDYARPHRAWIFGGLCMIPLVAAAATVRPLLLKQAVDVHIPGGDYLGLRRMALLFFAVVVVEFFSNAVQIYALQRAGHATIYDLRAVIFRHVMRLPARYFDKHPIGVLLSRSTSDVEALSEVLGFGVFTILTDMVMIVSILVAMFVLSAKLTLISLVAAPLLWMLVRYFSGALRSLQLEIRRAAGVQTGYLAEQLSGISVVQLYGREKIAHETFGGFGHRYRRATKLANVYDALLFSIMEGVSALSVAILLYFAAPEILIENALTLGLLFAFVDYLQRVFVPIREFSSKLAVIQRAAASLERVYELLDEPSESRAESGALDPLATWKGALSVRDLRFAYAEDGPRVLDGVSFDVAEGEVVAVVGRTGSGKTSLGRVLTRQYDGYGGSIRLVDEEGGHELRDLPPDHLRRHVLMVLQDVFLFDDSAAFNVSLGDPALEADGAALDRALETVQAADFLTERGGRSFRVGERGRNLSGGEAQLLAFARVAARQPNLLILDEATASVDSMTEQRVQQAIERLLQGRSVVVIAHRLSTVRHADKILVMDEGRLAESGNHDELMVLDGIYADLYRSGFE